MNQKFYSNGKLLITGEYLVLDGAKAFALPTKQGQHLHVIANSSNEINWKSFDYDGSVWFESIFLTSEITDFKKSETESVKNTLIKILHEAHLLNPQILSSKKGFTIETHLTFSRDWGLGTSSTLINNIAQWFKIDAFELLKKSFGGSGYDIACAQNDSAITYQISNAKPIVETFNFHPNFTQNIYFVYLNKKQNSKTAIQTYRNTPKDNLNEYIKKINILTQKAIHSNTIFDFKQTLIDHETVVSNLLKTKTIQQELFSDFNGVIKSLGAWGGDFVLVTSDVNPIEYFKNKGYETILPYREMIL